ncbi:MAG TPA: hypothetical protein VHO25_10195 [Polyangiaceae bacterium]|nr:hypothetical protein [Polyangiaceae bacterium]
MRRVAILVACCVVLGACGESASDDNTAAGGQTANAGGSTGLTAGNGAGGGSGSGGIGNGASGANNQGGAAGDTANAGAGGANVGGAAGAAGNAGAGGMPSGPPTGVTVATHDLDVQGLGAVFNVEDNYFRDFFIPPTPVANFGLHSQIIAHQNADGSLDVAWLDYTTGDEEPWALPAPGMIYLTHIDAALTTATTAASGVSSYKLLGFAKDAAGSSYLAYNADHALKTEADDDENNTNGNELHVAKLDGLGGTSWDTLLFGDQDNNADETKGDPAGAASSILGYDPMNDVLVLYLGHSMMWTPTRHQAGYFRLLNPASGDVLPPAGDDIIHFGSGWFYSHNFNQRLIIDDGDYYVLAHGDAYARQLGFARWSFSGYTDDNATDFDEPYWVIAGAEGDNNTNAQTGQFVKLADGRFAIAHTTSEGRNARDVRLVVADGGNGMADTAGAVWLTENPAGTHATMAKVALLGEYVLVTYALWTEDSHDLAWHAAILDSSLATVVAPSALTGVQFVDSAPLFQFVGGPHAGSVGWVSGNAAHTLTVGVAAASYD